jgi:hypothetical protein
MDTNGSSYLGQRTPYPYIIYTTDYTDFSSGVRALHMLCHALNRAGCEAYVMASVTNPWLTTPTLQLLRRETLYRAGRVPIVVYPEVVAANPLDLPVVARWLLNRPGAFIDNWKGAYQSSDMIFTYAERFLIDGLSGTRLHLPTCDTTVFNNVDNPHDGRREGYVFYTSRYLKTGGPVADFLSKAIVASPDNRRSPRELAQIYRRCEFFFTYERTAAAVEAALCGCPVIYLPSPLLDEIPDQNVFGTDGLALGFTPEEAARAKRTVGEVSRIYAGLLAAFDVELRRFIDITQERAAAVAAHVAAL